MSKVVGIIAEYNPFHNGHSYHIQNTKAQTGADFVVAVMTGNFTQRGNTSVINKWEKAKMALNGDADLVIELPTIYSVSSAENFANGAVKILNELGIVDTISFGMEADDVSTLNNIANVLVNEPPEYKTILEHELGKGNSFPKARENALMMYLNDIKRYANVVKGSNNILAIEYLKALKKQKSSIVPFGVKREKVYYNSTKIIDEYASATGIRNLLLHNQLEEVRKVMPSKSYSILLNNLRQGTYVLDIIAYNDEIIYKLRQIDNYFITHFLECPFCQGFWVGFIYSLILLPFTFIQSFSFGFITGFISYVYYFSTYLLFTKAEEEKCEWLKTQKPKNKK